MRRADTPEALAAAAAPALATIDVDARRAPKRLRPLFAAMRERLFDLDLDLDRILDDAGFTSAAVWSDLRAEIGQPAWSYLRDARLETAARLLLETSISVAEAGHLVGYSSVTWFRGLLPGFLGMPVSEYRRRAAERLQRAGRLPAEAEADDTWRRMLAGELSDAEARTLDHTLRRLAPESVPTASSAEDARRARLLRALAENLTDAAHPLPFGDQRRLIRDAVWFPETILFEHLSRGSRKATPDDPERGVELALLAVDSLAANGMLEARPEWAALAWARLARARWLAGDATGADQDLEQSTRDFERLPPDSDLATPQEAERCRIAAAFLWFRGRRREALGQADRSVTAHRVAHPEDLGRTLLLRAELRAAVAQLDVTAEEGAGGKRHAELRGALADLTEARGLEPPMPGPLVEAMITLRMRLLLRAGTPAERIAALPSLERAVEALGDHLTPHLLWFEGHCFEGHSFEGHKLEKQGAESREASWRQAREHFSRRDEPLWAARATLDLARLCLIARRPDEAAALASELASVLSARAASPQDLATLQALGRAVTAVGLEPRGRIRRLPGGHRRGLRRHVGAVARRRRDASRRPFPVAALAPRRGTPPPNAREPRQGTSRPGPGGRKSPRRGQPAA